MCEFTCCIVILLCFMAFLFPLLEIDFSIIETYFYLKYKNSLALKWLNYDLTPRSAEFVLKYINENYNAWKNNDKFTEEHFIYLLNLISLSNNKEKLLNEFKHCDGSDWRSSCMSRCGFNKNVIINVINQYLPRYLVD